MEISFIKDSKRHNLISCKRNDGTVTWMYSSSFFVVHDICHYAVETIMNFKNAFYGMLAEGTDISEFELPKERRVVQFTEQAIFTEQMVNLITIDYGQGQIENFTETLGEICSRAGISSVYRIEPGHIKQIRLLHKQLMERWNLLPDGEKMTLIFEE